MKAFDDYPRSPEELREIARTFADIPAFPMTRGQKGAIIGAFNQELGSDRARYMVWAWVFEMPVEGMSTKLLKDWQLAFLFSWCGFYEEDGHWQRQPNFFTEVYGVLAEAARDTS